MKRTEEKHPLLVVQVDQEDAGRGENLGAGEKVAFKLKAFRNKGRDRAKSLASGTVNIIRLWPDHLTTYILTLSMIILLIILIVNISVYWVTTPRSELPTRMDNINEECLKHKKLDLMLSTMNYRLPDAFVYIYVNSEEKGAKNIYADKLKFMHLTKIYERFHLNTITLINDTTNFISDYKYKRQEEEDEIIDRRNKQKFYLLHPRPLSEFFENSPLEKHWFKLSYEIVPFAVMVIALWEHGGLSIDLEKFNETMSRNKVENLRNLPNILDDSYMDDTMDSEPYSFIHFDKVRVNNIQDVLKLNEYNSSGIKRDSNSTSFIALNNTINKTSYVLNQTVAEPEKVTFGLNLLNNTIFNKSSIDINDTEIGSKKNGVLSKIKNITLPRIMSRRRDRGQTYKFLNLPMEDVALVDLNGMFLSVRQPCHAFLGQLMRQMQKRSDYRTAKEVIEDALRIFCRKIYKKGDHCKGVDVAFD